MTVAENNKRIAKNTSLLYIRMIVVMCIQLYTSRVILNALGISDYGLYNVIGGLVVMFSSLNMSLGSSTSRFFTVELAKDDTSALNKVFSTAMAIHITMAFIVFILAETIGLWFFYEKMVIPPDRISASMWVFQLSVVSSMFSITQVPYNAAIIAHERMNIIAYVGIGEAISKLLIAYLISFSPIDKLIIYAILIFMVQLTVMMTYRFYCIKHFRETNFNFQRDGSLYKSMLSYSLYDTVGCMAVMAQGQGLNMVLNVFCGTVVNAARAISYQIQAAVSQFASNFMAAVNPQIIKYYTQGNMKDMMQLVRRASIFSFAVLYMIILPVSLEIDYLLEIWLGEYPPYTTSFVVIILINELLNAFRRPRITIFHASGHIKLSNIITGGILFLALPLGYILMKLGYPPTFVFWGMLFTTILADFTNMILLKRYIDYSVIDFWKNVHLRCLFIIASVSFVPILIHNAFDYSFLRLGLVSLSSLISSIFIIWHFVMDENERNKIILLLKNKLYVEKIAK